MNYIEITHEKNDDEEASERIEETKESFLLKRNRLTICKLRSDAAAAQDLMKYAIPEYIIVNFN